MAQIKLLIVDDHKMVREGLKVFVLPIPDMLVVGEARDGAEAVEMALTLKPDVILLDLIMPMMDGIEATKAICRQASQARILIITSFAEDERVVSAIRAGASGYLLKDSSPQELETAIRAVSRGELYLPSCITRMVIQNFNRPEKHANSMPDLTSREKEVLKLVAGGHSNDAIAKSLVLSPWTVRSHIWRIMKKLQLENRTQVALYAVRSGVT